MAAREEAVAFPEDEEEELLASSCLVALELVNCL